MIEVARAAITADELAAQVTLKKRMKKDLSMSSV